MERHAAQRRLAGILLLIALAAERVVPAAAAEPLAAEPQPAGATVMNADVRGAYEASVASWKDELAVAWYDTRGRHAQIYARFDEGAPRRMGEMMLTHGKRHAYEPSLQVTSDRLIVAWYDKVPGSGELTARLGAWDKQGKPLWQRRLSVSGHFGRNPVVRVDGDAIFCAWLEAAKGRNPSVWVAWFDFEGRPKIAPRRAADASRDTWNLNAAIEGERQAWVVFDAHPGTRKPELFALRADPSAIRLRRLSADDGFASVYPDIAFEGSRVAVTWFDERDGNQEVYLFAGEKGELFRGADEQALDARARRVTTTPGASIGAYVAWNGRRGGLAWCDNTSGQYEIFFQQFDEDGAATASTGRLTHTEAWSLVPAIVPWEHGFALAWNEYIPAARKPASASRSNVVLARIDASLDVGAPGLPTGVSDSHTLEAHDW